MRDLEVSLLTDYVAIVCLIKAPCTAMLWIRNYFSPDPDPDPTFQVISEPDPNPILLTRTTK
jgi:hypothetical protein